MEVLWSSRRILMEFSCSSHGVLMEVLWSSRRVLMEFSWSPREVLMELSELKQFVEFSCCSCCFLTELLQGSHGVVTENHKFLMGFSKGLMGFSRSSHVIFL